MPTVLHLIESWGPGGAETVYLEVADRIRRRGWKSLTALPREGWLGDRLRQRGLVPLFTGGKGGWDFTLLRELVELILKRDVDLVHSHLFGSALYGGVAAKVAGVPCIASFHGLWDVKEASGYRRIKIPMVDWLCHRRIFVSKALRRSYLEDVGMRSIGTRVIENGIDTGQFAPRLDRSFRNELGVSDEEFLVGTVGNVRPAKNHGLFLQVASQALTLDDDFRFVLVGEGEGELYRELRRERRRLGLESRVEFAGFRSDVARVFNSLDAFLLTSNSEGFSLTTVQAMASGLPVIATRCGGPEDLIEDERTGFLVSTDESEEIVRLLSKLKGDESLRTQIGERAREKVEQRYSITRMLNDYHELYQEVLRDRRGA